MRGIFRTIIFIQAIIVSCIYAITFHFSPLYGEDYGLTRRFTTEGVIDRLVWAAGKSANQIEGWNARLGEQLSIFSLSMPSYFFYIIAMVSVAILCYVIATLLYDVDNKLNAFAVSILLTFLFWPGFELFLWRTVITGYTVPMTVTLTVISKFMTAQRRNALISSKLKLSGYCFLALLSGLSFENVPVATVFFLLGVLLLSKQLLSRLTLIPLFTLIGWVILIIAPSTSHRRALYNKWYHHDVSFIDGIKERVFDVISVFSHTSLVLFIASIISLVYLYYQRKVFKEHDLLLIAALLVVGSMVASPYTEPRSFMFSWCVMLAFVVSAARQYMVSNKYGSLALILLGVLAIFVIHTVYKVNREYFDLINARSISVESQLDGPACKTGIKINLVDGFKDYRYLNNRDEWYYYNLPDVSKYYGCKIVN